ncbi:MAG: transposase [Clostridiales bacterium]|nr:transposase [Clostridiales bacterium]
MGRFRLRRTKVRAGQGAVLSQGSATLLRYLEDGRLELNNNQTERNIKPFVIGRKNFLVCQYPFGHPGQQDNLRPD